MTAQTDPRAGESAAALSARDIVFGWRPGQRDLDIAEFDIARGERVFLRGPSGSGKSTLLSLAGGIVAPRSGQLQVLDEDMRTLGAARRDALRASHLGVIFQMFNLVPYLTVLENVLLPARYSSIRRRRAGGSASAIDAEARRLLSRLGLEETLLHRKATDLSVGQQQRVAAARALLGRPSLVLADEPTSALDTDAREAFIRLLSEECAASSAALLFVSHDLSLAPLFDRTVDLRAINRAASPDAAKAA